jgi:hypothetical protein
LKVIALSPRYPLGRFTLAIATAVALLLTAGRMSAEEPFQTPPTGWSAPYLLSGWSDDLPALVPPPRMTGDAEGRLHVVWTAGLDETEGGDTIYYVTGDGQYWSEPLELFVAPAGVGSIVAGDIIATTDGQLAVAWFSGSATYVSVAAIADAGNAQAWQTHFAGPGIYPRLAIAEDGRWYLVTSDTTRVYLLQSDDQGRVWAGEQVVWQAPSGAAPKNGHVLLTTDGAIHLVWSEATARLEWNGEAIWHAELMTGAGLASIVSVREITRHPPGAGLPTVDFPVIAGTGNGEMVIVWNNGVGSTTGRFFQASSDNGRSWSDVKPLFPGLSGQTGSAGLVADSGGTLHLLTPAPGPDGYQLVRHATWSDGRWSNSYQSIAPGDPYAPMEYASATITHGNRLHLVGYTFIDGPAYRAVAYVSRLIDVAYSEPPGLAQPALAPELVVTPPEAPSVEPTATVSSPPVRTDLVWQSPPAQELESPIIWAIAPTAILLALVALYHQWRVSRR